MLPLASKLEGHPDNVASCLFGGLTIAWAAGGAAHAVHLQPAERITPVAFVAPEPVSTKVARGLLPPPCRTPTPRATPAAPRCSSPR